MRESPFQPCKERQSASPCALIFFCGCVQNTPTWCAYQVLSVCRTAHFSDDDKSSMTQGFTCPGTEIKTQNPQSCPRRCSATSALRANAAPEVSVCKTTQYGCCSDGVTPAMGPDMIGCQNICKRGTGEVWCDTTKECIRPWETTCASLTLGSCSESQYGCCNDGKTSASGPNFAGCENSCSKESGEVWCDASKRCIRPWQESCCDVASMAHHTKEVESLLVEQCVGGVFAKGPASLHGRCMNYLATVASAGDAAALGCKAKDLQGTCARLEKDVTVEVARDYCKHSLRAERRWWENRVANLS
jgi:hypothetical protein